MNRYRIYWKSLATGQWMPTPLSYESEAMARLLAFEQVRRMDAYSAAVVDRRFHNRPCDVFFRDSDGVIMQRCQRVHVKRQRSAANG